MTDTTHSISLDDIAGRTGAPHIAGTGVALTTNRYDQEEVARVLTSGLGPEFARFAQTSGVQTRSLALPLSRYPELTGFTEANAFRSALRARLQSMSPRVKSSTLTTVTAPGTFRFTLR